MTAKFGSTKCKRESHLKKKSLRRRKRQLWRKRKWFWKRQYNGASLIRGQGLATKDTLSTEKRKKQKRSAAVARGT